VTLIGATTENPYYEVNSALISRTQVYELEPLSRRGLARSSGAARAELGVEAGDASRRAGRARVRRRRANGAQHPRARSRDGDGGGLVADGGHVEDAARKPPLVYDKAGDAHYDFTSAFIKSMRGGDADAPSTTSPRCSRRRGRALHRAPDDRARLRGHRERRPARAPRRGRAAQAVEHVGLRRRASTSRRRRSTSPRAEVERELHGAERATADVQERGAARPPKALRDGSWYGRRLGHGEGYVYPHDDPSGFETSYLPEELEGRRYYEPSGSGEESAETEADGSSGHQPGV
jgi:putative ATPase